ncbi:52 kDa repressor of the inhibitor of the protein kinase isoform X2 [Drosophila serrata]|uniref:52 kDa repressor of the inhibitor of the protein kinase isoform X2 n=1 Tax=Drosophila serrata TaxID=7274 RepID=UPI000A1CF68A|nr:52 kDa repressor of the inhibitor of the protein kinase isoform X2 [Drosophila serrata]
MYKLCVYKDCGYSYSVVGSTPTKGQWTIFSFPKNPERARIWLENAQVHPKISKNQLFLCSKHFDTKFISSNRNRTMLVGEAIPIPYTKDKDPDPKEEYCAALEDFSTNVSDDELDELIQEAVKNSVNKSKEPKTDMMAKKNNTESPPAKRSRESTSAAPVAIESPTTKSCSTDSDPEQMESIDTSEVSVFQFKGQEYVQMSMEFYMLEKRKMSELVKDYRRTLQNIKDQVSECLKGNKPIKKA